MKEHNLLGKEAWMNSIRKTVPKELIPTDAKIATGLVFFLFMLRILNILNLI